MIRTRSVLRRRREISRTRKIRSPILRGPRTGVKAQEVAADGAPRPRRVGFWRDPDNPQTAEWPNPHDWVDPAWDPAERAAVIEYLERGSYGIPAMGYSWCRFRCGIPDREMGSQDGTDGVYVWPEGLTHYLRAHDVKPPEEFLEHVRRRLQNR